MLIDARDKSPTSSGVQGLRPSTVSLSLRKWVCHPFTRTHVRLLGPCFKTGRWDGWSASLGQKDWSLIGIALRPHSGLQSSGNDTAVREAIKPPRWSPSSRAFQHRYLMQSQGGRGRCNKWARKEASFDTSPCSPFQPAAAPSPPRTPSNRFPTNNFTYF